MVSRHTYTRVHTHTHPQTHAGEYALVWVLIPLSSGNLDDLLEPCLGESGAVTFKG